MSLIQKHCRESPLQLLAKGFQGHIYLIQLLKKIQEIRDKIGLDYKKITRTITDNASNFAKAFREFGFKEQNENDDQESSEYEVNFESINGMVIFTGKNDEELFVLPMQERCFPHTLSLIATTDIKKTSYSALHKKIFTSSFEKTTPIWNKCNLPKSAKIIFNICKRNLVTHALQDGILFLTAYNVC